jgi:formyl-CoA transferase
LVNVASNYLVSGKLPKRYGNAHPNIVPYQTFKAKDRYFNIAVGNDHQWKQLAEKLNDPRLKAKEFETNPDRVRNRDKLIPILQEIFSKKTAKEWLNMLKEISVPCGEINTLEDVFNDPQIEYRNLLGKLKHPKRKDLPDLKLVLSPIKFKNRAIKDPSYPPALGEHTQEVLSKIKD